MASGLVRPVPALSVPPAPAITPAAGNASPIPLVRIPFPQEDGSLTPYSFELGHPLVNLIYDTLMWRDEQGVPQPWLARSVDTSTDGLRLTIALTEGVHWHDGSALTADDVAFTFSYVASHPHPRFSDELAAVSRVRATGPMSVEIDLTHPSPGFADQPLSDLPILPRHLWQDIPAGQVPGGLPVGSGPYRLVDHQTGTSYRFESNRDYFRGRPNVDIIEMPIIGDADKTIQALERREVDMVPLSLSDDLAARLGGFGVRFARGASYQGTVLMFNVRIPPFDRAEVRQAVAEAIDLDRLTRSVARAVPADHGYLHPESRYAPKEVLHRLDPGLARPILASLDAPIVVVVANSDATRVEAGRQVVLALQRAGAKAELKTMPVAEFSGVVGIDGSAPAFGAAIWGAPNLASDDPDFLRRLFGSTGLVTSLNYGGYRSTQFDTLSNQIAASVDPAARRAAVKETLRLLATDAPVVPLYFPEAAFGFRPSVYDGWLFVKGSGVLDKRSFLGSRPKTLPTGDSPSSRSSGGHSPVALAAGALGTLTVLLATGGLVVSRRQR